MATQEIGLNHALHQAGIHAYETDLAELIIQLANDQPSHLLVPAIHKNRTEIRDLFTTTLHHWGRPAPPDLTDNPTHLAEAARLHLREKFLTTKTAISGANFLIAETGTITLIESEGNGRMCLTLPDTLITIAGIDKIIPTWQDLEVLLQTLPRSSTAERMNPYTSTWTGTTPGDGPQNLHLILLDNGRTDTLADPTGRQALRCIRCSACLNVCPVYERAGGHAYDSPYPGPIGAILTPQLHATPTPLDTSLPYASTLCGACYDVCPVAINIPDILAHLRHRVAEDGIRGTRDGAGRSMKAGDAGCWTTPRRSGSPARARRAHPRAAPEEAAVPRPGQGVERAPATCPTYPQQSFRDWWKNAAPTGRSSVSEPHDRKDAAR